MTYNNKIQNVDTTPDSYVRKQVKCKGDIAGKKRLLNTYKNFPYLILIKICPFSSMIFLSFF